jgi:hypothetical protein
MKALPNDDFDACCGNRPLVEFDAQRVYGAWIATCGLCGDRVARETGDKLMIDWNKRQREKVTT